MEQNIEERISSLSPEQMEKFNTDLERALHDRAWFAYYNLNYAHFDIDKVREIVLKEGYYNSK